MKTMLIIYVMSEGNCVIAARKANNRRGIARSLKCMSAATAVDVNTKPDGCTNMIKTKTREKTR